MTPLDQAYEEILDPVSFVKNFATMGQFAEWARGGLINDLKEAIRVFEHYELFEHCAVMLLVIDEKVDEMLSGFGIE